MDKVQCAGADPLLPEDLPTAAPVHTVGGCQPLAPEQEFALAINNYRQSGGGNFPAVKTAPVLSNSQQEIRQRIIDYVVDHGTLDVAVFSQANWRLTVNGAPLTVTA